MAEGAIKALLIEDSPTQALSMLAEMETAGAVADHATSLADGLDMLRDAAYDVILVDLNLPDSQGSATVERTCRKAFATPVIVLTGHDDAESVLKALELGAQDYLVKGQADAAHLRQAFRYAIHRKKAEGELIGIQDELRIRVAELEDNRERLEAQSANLVGMAEDLAVARDLALQANKELEKRIREADCLYGVSRTLDDPGLPLGEALQRVVDLIPPALRRFPSAGARLYCPGICRADAVATANFREGAMALRAEIMVQNRAVGHVEVVCLGEASAEADGPFLPSERKLIEELGRRIGLALERVRLQDELRRLATTDSLTGANNRRHFLEEAERELQRGRRYGRPVSLLMLDIDHFKRINDDHGHAMGDEVLKAIVGRIQRLLREQDILGRLGGEEFAVVLPEAALVEARQAAERLREEIGRGGISLPGGGDLRVTCSIGVAECASPNETLEEGLNRADAALYRAKEEGRDRVAAAAIN